MDSADDIPPSTPKLAPLIIAAVVAALVTLGVVFLAPPSACGFGKEPASSDLP